MKVELLFVAEKKGTILYVKPTQNLQMDELRIKCLIENVKGASEIKILSKQKPQFMS